MKILAVAILALFTSCRNSADGSGANEAAADTCDGPDANIRCCFENMPENLSPVMTIAGPEEPGEKLCISGTIFEKDGKAPAPGVILYAYHTDSKGYYSPSGKEKGFQKWHGHLHGWCRSDSAGRYEIRTVRPASYPEGNFPAHIHSVVWPPGREPLYIYDFVFKDDPNVNESYLASLEAPGDKGVVDLSRDSSGIWKGFRNITIVHE